MLELLCCEIWICPNKFQVIPGDAVHNPGKVMYIWEQFEAAQLVLISRNATVAIKGALHEICRTNCKLCQCRPQFSDSLLLDFLLASSLLYLQMLLNITHWTSQSLLLQLLWAPWTDETPTLRTSSVSLTTPASEFNKMYPYKTK